MKYVRITNPDYHDAIFRDSVAEVLEEVPKRYLIAQAQHPEMKELKFGLRLKYDHVQEISQEEYFKEVLRGTTKPTV